MPAPIKEQMQASLTAAMKVRDSIAMSALRQALSAIAVAETSGEIAVELSDDQVQAVLAVEVRKHMEAFEAFEGAGRSDRAAQERAEAAVLQVYLPAAMSDDELARSIADEVAAAGADGVTGMKAMGRVVSAVRARAGATADGAKIASMVKAALQAPT